MQLAKRDRRGVVAIKRPPSVGKRRKERGVKLMR